MIDSIGEAVEVAKKLIEKRCQDKIVDVSYINKNRHCILTTEKGLTYYILFKREFFMSFGVTFNLKGVGDSINAKYLGIALNLKIDGFLFVYRNGYVYYISPQEIFDLNLVRETKSGERTYSFILSFHRRWK